MVRPTAHEADTAFQHAQHGIHRHWNDHSL